MGSSYSTANIPSQEGKVVVITGGNTGIGKVCALELAARGAHVILACRSADRALPVVEEIKKETNNEKVEFMELNLANLRSVVRFTDAFREKKLPIHVLLNNAGIMACPYRLSDDGIELQFATNHLGHFLLTTRLLDIVEASAPSRIVNVSSLAHTMSYNEGVRFDKINDEKSYSIVSAYGQSKLCNVLFSNELNKRLEGKLVFVNSLHPGYVDTELTRNVKDSYGSFVDFLSGISAAIVAKTPQDGALTSLYVATSPEIEGTDGQPPLRGQYFVPTAKLSTASKKGRDEQLAKKLWEFSEALIKEKLGEGEGEGKSEDSEHKEDSGEGGSGKL